MKKVYVVYEKKMDMTYSNEAAYSEPLKAFLREGDAAIYALNSVAGTKIAAMDVIAPERKKREPKPAKTAAPAASQPQASAPKPPAPTV